MFIKIRCQNPGFGGRSRAKRRFESGTEYRMEVIDQPDDFTDADGTAGDMTRCNRAAMDSIMKDPCFTVVSSEDTTARISEDVLESVRAHAAALASKLSGVEFDNARLKAENAELTAKLAAASAVNVTNVVNTSAPAEASTHQKGGHKK